MTTKATIVDADEKKRIRRTHAAVQDANFEVDAKLLVELVDSGNAPALLAGELLKPVDPKS